MHKHAEYDLLYKCYHVIYAQAFTKIKIIYSSPHNVIANKVTFNEFLNPIPWGLEKRRPLPLALFYYTAPARPGFVPFGSFPFTSQYLFVGADVTAPAARNCHNITNVKTKEMVKSQNGQSERKEMQQDTNADKEICSAAASPSGSDNWTKITETSVLH